MTEPNLFQELEDDLQRQKYEDLWRKIGPYVLGLAFVILVTTALVTTWHSLRTSENQKATHSLIVIDAKKGEGTNDILPSLEKFVALNGNSSQADLARLQAAALAAKNGDSAKALTLYRAVSAEAKIDPSLRQLATLQAIKMQVDTGDAAGLLKELAPLTQDNEPWVYTAREVQGFLVMKTGDKAQAAEIFSRLAHDPEAPKTLAERAGNMSRYLANN